MSDAELSVLLNILAIPAGGLIAGLILWAILFRDKGPRP